MNAQKMVLADPSHKLPMPGGNRLFAAAGEMVDLHDPFWRALAADGSIKPAPVETAKIPAPTPAAAPSAAPVATTSMPGETALAAAEEQLGDAMAAIEALRHPHA